MRKRRRNKKMSKFIRFPAAMRDEARREFEEALMHSKLADGKFNFTKTLTAPPAKASLLFTPQAFAKMLMLVNGFSSEVAWHGVAFRGDDPEKNEYLVSDILVYPQEVTGTTVNTDQEKYQNWLMELDDETFPHIRMQGHSHVNMSTTPSGVDLTHQEKILDQLDDDMFYIFVIWNKRMEHTVKIYDLQKGLLFEPGDITVSMTTEGVSFEEFMKDAHDMVVTKTYTPPAYNSRYDTDYWNKKYGTGNYSKPVSDPNKPITKPVSSLPASTTPASAAPAKAVSSVSDTREKSTIDEDWDCFGIFGQQRINDLYD
jgi:hypothetical protein